MPGAAHRNIGKPYQFKVSASMRRSKVEPGLLPPTAKPMEEQGGLGSIIQGQRVASKEEWRLAMALEAWGLNYRFQVPIRGGRSRRGGLVVDFVVYDPWEIAVQVQGQYWHTGIHGASETIESAQIRKVFGRLVEFTDQELGSMDMAKAAVMQKIIQGGGV